MIKLLLLLTIAVSSLLAAEDPKPNENGEQPVIESEPLALIAGINLALLILLGICIVAANVFIPYMINQKMKVLPEMCEGLAAIEKEFIYRVLPDQALKEICTKINASYPVLKLERATIEKELEKLPALLEENDDDEETTKQLNKALIPVAGTPLNEVTSKETMSTDLNDTRAAGRTSPMTGATTVGARASTVLQTWE